MPMARSGEEWRSSASTRKLSDWKGDAGLPARPLGVRLDHTSTPILGANTTHPEALQYCSDVLKVRGGHYNKYLKYEFIATVK